MKRLLLPMLALGCALMSGMTYAAVVSWDFVVMVNTVIRNTSPLSVNVGDLLAGRMSVNLKDATGTVLVTGYEMYVINKKATISVTVDCNRFVRAIDQIHILDNYYQGPTTPNTLDRFFLSAGDIHNDGIQFWIDDYSLSPTLLTSLDIPTDPLDLAKVTSSTFLLVTTGLAIQADFVELRDNGPSAVFDKPKCGGQPQ